MGDISVHISANGISTYRICLAAEHCYAFLDLSLRSVESIEECDNILRFLAVDPIRVGIVGWDNVSLICPALQPSRYSPSKVRVLLISPMMSLLSLRASSNEDSRLILRRKDSNCFMSVRIVIVVSAVESGASGKPAFGRGI